MLRSLKLREKYKVNATNATRIAMATSAQLNARLALGSICCVVASLARSSDAAEPTACADYDTEYVVVAHVVVRNTVLGAANGTYPLGVGRMKLGVSQHDGIVTVKLVSYETDNRLSLVANIGPLGATFLTASRTTVTPNACDGSAHGTLRGPTLTWISVVAGYRSDGTTACAGAMCGKFGSPPRGTSPFHETSPAMKFSDFTFSVDGETFTMPYTLLSKSESPRQTTYLSLAGRRVNQSCRSSRALPCDP
jgi:hypothetical protein